MRECEIVDLHTHIVPEEFPTPGGRASADRWPSMDHIATGRANVMIAGQNFRTVTETCWNPQRRITDLHVEGAHVQVLSPMPELLSYWMTPNDGLEICRYLNDFIGRLVDSSPLHFYGLGVVPLQDPDLAAQELSAIKQAGLVGIELGSNILGKSLGEERFHAFFEEVERQNLAVFVHALHPTFADRIVGPEWLDNSVGFQTDTGLTISSLLTGGTLDRCPTLRLAFSHGGGTFPWVLPRMQHAWSGTWNEEPPQPEGHGRPRPMQQLMQRSPLEYARSLYYDTLVFDHRAIRYLLDVIGPKQLTVGTDYPFVPREQPIAKTLMSMGLTDDDWEDICSRNALRFLGVADA